MAQLLIDMPAEGAARLLVLSLLDQLSLHAPPFNGAGAAAGVLRRDEAYMTALNRLRASISLYGEVLGPSVPRRVRRHLRAIVKAATRLRDVDEQLEWLARAPHPASDWLRERLGRRRVKVMQRLEQIHRDQRPFRRLAKRLSVYTTAVRLDDVEFASSFGSLTARQLVTAARSLRDRVAAICIDDDRRKLARVRRVADRVVFLIEPVRSSAGASELAETAHELRDAVARLEALAIVADALIDGGRRIGALHMMTRVRRTVWPWAAHAPNGGAGSQAVHTPDEIGPGLVSLAELLRAECSVTFDAFAARWLVPEAASLFTEIEQLSAGLAMSS